MKLIYDEKFLRQKSKPVSVAKGLKLGRELHKFLENHNKFKSPQGVGLSAIQVGIPESVCVIQYNSQKLTLINPEIVDVSVFQYPSKEGCLSFPGKVLDVYRPVYITIKTSNIGKQTYRGVWATIVDHEVDHIFGVLFMDKTTDTSPAYIGFRSDISNVNPIYWGLSN